MPLTSTLFSMTDDATTVDTTPAQEATISTFNHFLVGTSGRGITINNPPRLPMSHAEALNLAAYIVALVGDYVLWTRTLEAIENV